MSRCTHGGINDGEDCGICASEATLCAELAVLRDENARLKEALRALRQDHYGYNVDVERTFHEIEGMLTGEESDDE